MKTIKTAVLLGIVLSFTCGARAAETSERRNISVGGILGYQGASVDTWNKMAPVGLMIAYRPVDFLSLGAYETSAIGGLGSSTLRVSSVIGLSVSACANPFYAGVGFGFGINGAAKNTSSATYSDNTSSFPMHAGPIVGADFMVSPIISIGAEGRLLFHTATTSTTWGTPIGSYQSYLVGVTLKFWGSL